MKRILLGVAFLIGATSVNAQTPVGTVVSNFTLTDINGQTHDLFSYLDAGKTVVIDVSATWCGPCWNYHNTHALNDFYNTYGPAGTNQAMAFFIEGDPSTTNADLHGTGGNTQGDWVTGENLPIIDLANQASFENSGMVIPYYPVMYVVCPNRTILASGVAGSIGTASALAGYIGQCPVANGTNNGALLNYTGETATCGGAVNVSVNLQNMGSANLTSATIEVLQGTTSLLSYNWTGNLPTYGVDLVNVGSINVSSTATYTIKITSPDDNTNDNTLTQQISLAPQASNLQATVQIVTDAYGSETTWELKNGAGTVISSGGPYNNLTAVGTTTQTPVNVTLSANECYEFVIYDSYGDGINAGYGQGSFTVTDGSGSTLVSGGVFEDEDSGKFKTGAAGLGENEISGVNIYPNPATDVLNVSFEANDADYVVTMTDLQGRVVAVNAVNAVSGAQNVAFDVANVAKGSYIVTISSANGVYTQNVVVK